MSSFVGRILYGTFVGVLLFFGEYAHAAPKPISRPQKVKMQGTPLNLKGFDDEDPLTIRNDLTVPIQVLVYVASPGATTGYLEFEFVQDAASKEELNPFDWAGTDYQVYVLPLGLSPEQRKNVNFEYDPKENEVTITLDD